MFNLSLFPYNQDRYTEKCAPKFNLQLIWNVCREKKLIFLHAYSSFFSDFSGGLLMYTDST